MAATSAASADAVEPARASVTQPVEEHGQGIRNPLEDDHRSLPGIASIVGWRVGTNRNRRCRPAIGLHRSAGYEDVSEQFPKCHALIVLAMPSEAFLFMQD